MRSERRSTTPRGTMWCYNHMGIEATAICQVCRRALCEACASRLDSNDVCDACNSRATLHPHFLSAAPGKLVPGSCYQHEYTPASVFCSRCARPMCRGCARPFHGRYACADCVTALEHEVRPPTTTEWVAAALILVVLAIAFLYLRSVGVL